MTASIEKPRDLAGGLLVMAVGAGFLLSGRTLTFGSALRMGPGYFPTILSVLMILLGAVIALQALRRPYREGTFGHVAWRGLVLIVGTVVFFGLTLRGLGLAPALLVVVFAAAWASRYASLRASVPLAIGVAAFCTVLFIQVLGLPLPLVGAWFSAEYWSPAISAPTPTR